MPRRASVHAARAGDLIYTAGMSARERDGSIAAKGDLAAQADKVYADLGRVLRAAGARWQDVVKVNYYVAPSACSAAGSGGASQRRSPARPRGAAPRPEFPWRWRIPAC